MFCLDPHLVHFMVAIELFLEKSLERQIFCFKGFTKVNNNPVNTLYIIIGLNLIVGEIRLHGLTEIRYLHTDQAADRPGNQTLCIN